jgi:UDP-N-acetylglucosamine/UDP-N-acetylgalactosamine diphosphorylase
MEVSMDIKYKKAVKRLKKYGQEHLLKFYDQLQDDEKEYLINQILKTDFATVIELYNGIGTGTITKEIEIVPLDHIKKNDLTSYEIKMYEDIGIDIITSKKYAVVTMAGGQGTRLGINGPKGTFMLGIDPDKSLFEIFCDKLKEAKDKYGVIIPWYIMTSVENNKETIEFFEKNNYFDYPKKAIKFFKQSSLPMIDKHGRIILSQKYEIKEASSGNGGVFQAMLENGITDELAEKGIKWVFIGGVDNPLLKLVDPLFLGMTKNQKFLAASKSVMKKSPDERVGVFCRKNGKPGIIEYTELPKDMAILKDSNGELVYGDSNIVVQLFNIKLLKKIASNKLPYHCAQKKSEYIDDSGNNTTPKEENGYKFETFIFDSYTKAKDILILRVNREEEFAPIKNAEGNDSPSTARELYLNYMEKNK